MRIVFLGTPEYARVTLTCLCQSRHQVLAVVTGPAQKSGRGQKLLPTACYREAERRGLTVLTPSSLKDEGLYQYLRELQADVFVVCAFRILPPRLFSLPNHGSINVHASLLPKYRGAAPINWALINGEKTTGLTSFFLRKSVDTGEMILQEIVPIEDNDTFDTLYARMADLSGPFVLKTLDMIESGDVKPIPQDETQASRAPKIEPLDAMIDFGFPAERVRNFVRGMSTRPGAFTYFRKKRLKVHACAVENVSEKQNTRPGKVIEAGKKLVVQCDNSAVELLRVVPEGKTEMDAGAFINGYRVKPGEIFGEIPRRGKEKK